ncbi:hypothetical protein BMF94_1428 [Rhodotorula taiwanensis]|uniref:Glycosyltransferase family 4 protein n=1 Tax=Rhodotorula taiwanensis TaxID=741276 RepID=A0A2S5BFH5_9BASI|nr:hypothetical protein BMF94_1428 [Rhodotorula taiwanensis]
MAGTASLDEPLAQGQSLLDRLRDRAAAFAVHAGIRRRRFVPPLVTLLVTLVFWETWTTLPHGRRYDVVADSWSHRVLGAFAARGSPRVESDYQLSADPLPVHHIHERIHFHNTPLSPHRPARNQFLRASGSRTYRQGGPPPVISIVTATQNPRRVMLETAATVFGQSLQNFEWVIVDDHSTDAESLAILAEIAQDPRVIIIPNEGADDIATCRNVGLRWVLSPDRQRDGTVPKYLANLDDDDLYEFTALEKTVWMLESNPDWDLGGFHVIKFGASNETVTSGVHSGATNFFSGNFVPGAAVYSSRAVLKSGCRYDEVNFAIGGEDWDFWLCLAENGHWGGTVPEPLFWYRGNEATFRKQRWGNLFVDGFAPLKARIDEKHRGLSQTGSFPDIPPRPSRQLDAITWEAPYENHLTHFEKSIMFIIPWLFVGGADIGALHQIQLYAEQGYRVTVVCTLHRPPDGLELRPRVLQFTHDIHVLPSFLSSTDLPRYIKYLLDSRGIGEVILCNSQLVYEMLPALVERVPHVKFIDYLHNEAYNGWKSGGYPTYSLLSQRYLSRTITCSSYLRDWLIARGHANPASIGVVKLGIEVSDFSPASEAHKAEKKKQLLGVGPETTVIGVVGRLDPQKRADLVPDIADELRKAGKYKSGDFVIIMIGDGDLKAKVTARIAQVRVHDFVRVLGTIDAPQDYLAATDIFLLPSMSEGISIAVAEAMAMALPIVTANAGALPEQLGFTDDDAGTVAGVLVDHNLDVAHDAPLYAEAIHSLVLDPVKREALGKQGRLKVETTFNWRDTLRGMFDEVRKACLPDLTRSKHLPHPAAHYAIQNLLLEAHDETDLTAFWTRMKARVRSGAGRVLQERCDDSSKELSRWIDKLEQPRKCDNAKIKAALSNDKLQRSANFQCGNWCVFDLTRADYAGWSFNGDCWTPFDEEVPLNCKKYWSFRPAGINLSL